MSERVLHRWKRRVAVLGRVPHCAVGLLSVLLAGCMVMPQPYDVTKLSAEQITALSRDKASIVSCTTAQYLFWRVTTMFINIDMGSRDGAVIVGSDCTSTLTVSKPHASP